MARAPQKKVRREEGEEEEEGGDDDEDFDGEGGDEEIDGEEGDNDIDEEDFGGDFAGISGPDSEEILSELLEEYAERDLVLFHRAVAEGVLKKVTKDLKDHPDWLESTLIDLEAFPEVKKCNYIDFGSFSRFSNVRFQSTPYPDVEQVVTGYDGKPNELYPTGQIDEPETDLDSAFWTPLLRACKCGKTQVMKHLLNAGANKNYESPCRANVISCLLDGIREDNDELAKNIALVATLENINIREFMNDVLTDEELSELVVVNALLSNGYVLKADSEIFSDDMESWIDAEIVKVLKANSQK
jgi:hypothetical protein